jgi:dephospho-CoA kinase
MILKVGLTGGIASGKSTVARTFAGLGAQVIDADAIVARLYRPGQPGHEALVRRYGPEILQADGEIDRSRLTAVAFRDHSSTTELNALIHPLVIDEVRRLMQGEQERFPDRDRIVIVEATLLLESGSKQDDDKVIVVDADPAQQVDRGVRRGMAADDVIRRMGSQMSRSQRLAAADYVIDNSGDPIATEAQTRRVFESLCQDLARKKVKTTGA